MTENKIIEILMKEAHTELDLGEKLLLDQFRALSAENAAFIDDNREVLQNIPTYEGESKIVQFDVDQALAKVNGQKARTAKVVKLNPTHKPTHNPIQKKSNSLSWLAAAIVVFGLGTLLYTFMGNQSDILVYTSGDEIKTVILSDGSEVTLNKQSTLRLSEGFGVHLRDMNLEGEAYFKVKNNDDQPFTVSAGPLKVEVIGTEFNIKNRPSHEAITVFVHEGKVKVSNSKTRSKELLIANQSTQFDKGTNRLLKDAEASVNATSWLTKKLSFNNITLENAIEDIEAHFNIDVTLQNSSCVKRPYTSLFNEPNPNEVLEAMSASFDFQIIQNGKKSYQLTGGQCN